MASLIFLADLPLRNSVPPGSRHGHVNLRDSRANDVVDLQLGVSLGNKVASSHGFDTGTRTSSDSSSDCSSDVSCQYSELNTQY